MSESLDSDLTLKMTITHVVETSVTNNSLSEDYLHLDDHTKQIMIPLGSNHLPSKEQIGLRHQKSLWGLNFPHIRMS